jgi:flagellar hook assembly protein FlgD
MTDSLVIDTITPVIVPVSKHMNTINLSVHPNPFVNTTKISYTLPKTTDVTMTIFSMDGTLIRTLSSEKTAGEHVVVWDGRDNNGRHTGPGVYLLKLTAGEVYNKKLMLIK